MPEKGPLTKDEIECWLDLDERRKKAARLAEDLGKQQTPITARIDKYIAEHGGADRTTVHHGFVLKYGQRKSQPAWKDEFISVTSQEKAEELRAAAPMKDYVIVEPVAAWACTR